MRSHRIIHDWVTNTFTVMFIILDLHSWSVHTHTHTHTHTRQAGFTWPWCCIHFLLHIFLICFITDDVHLVTWLRSCLPGFSTLKLLLSLLINMNFVKSPLRLDRYPSPHQTFNLFTHVFLSAQTVISSFIQRAIIHHYHYLFWSFNGPTYG